MQPCSTVRVKICCISTPEEASMAVRAGASAIGLVSAMPSGPGVIDEDRIGQIAATVPPGVTRVLLTCAPTAGEIAAQKARCLVDAIQIVETIEVAEMQALRKMLPDTPIVQVIHVRGPESIDEAITLAPHADALLLDSGNPSAATKELGGTGRAHDWTLSREIRVRVPVPLFLAGGLKPENVAEAIETVRPYGVDVCTGVRTLGKLDEKKLDAFLEAVQSVPRPSHAEPR